MSKQKLTPAKNFRKTIVRCCGTCVYLETSDMGGSECQRNEGFSGDVGDRGDIYCVCDGWKKADWIEFQQNQKSIAPGHLARNLVQGAITT